jgi:purine nucleoside phosphorylase
MDKREVDRRVAHAKKVVAPAFEGAGDRKFLGIIPGTGWGDGLKEGGFEPLHEFGYDKMKIPGADSRIAGHSKSMRVGLLHGRPVVVMGRVHPNEANNPDLVYAMRIVIESVREHLEGLIITNGVGTLHGPINEHLGAIQSRIHTAVINYLAYIHSGRKSEPIGIGDVSVTDSFDTLCVGKDTPLFSGEFVDPHHNGYHRDNDRYLGLGRDAVRYVQGRAPLAKFSYIHGPQFEGPGEKIAARARGCDVIGMSGLEGLVAKNVPFTHLTLATNGAFAPHSHKGNLDVGEQKAKITAAILEVLMNMWPRS